MFTIIGKGLLSCLFWGALAYFCFPPIGFDTGLGMITLGDVARGLAAIACVVMAGRSFADACIF